MSVATVATTGPEALLASPTLPLLTAFHTAGVLGLADVHTAEAVTRIGGERDERVALALALAVRALRNGSVCLDLRTVAEHVFDEDASVEADAVPVDLDALAWPEPDEWLAACRASPARSRSRSAGWPSTRAASSTRTTSSCCQYRSR